MGSAKSRAVNGVLTEEHNNFDLPETRPDNIKMGRSFHEALVRERDKTHNFDDIYEIKHEIGSGGLCKIFEVEKKHSKIGGSSRPDLVRRKMVLFDCMAAMGYSRNSHHGTSAVSHVGPERQPSGGPMRFALKVINLALVKEDKIDQLKNEVEILKTLDHKNIIKAYETFQMRKNKKLMIVMELCSGGDMYARMPYTEMQVARVMRQVLSAISYMHSKHIIHRDVKLENLIFESNHPEAFVKVIDFGLSKAFAPLNHILTERVGTLYSMSPETMKGIYTLSADLWSIAVCTYIMLANGAAKPFEGKTPKQLVANVLRCDYNFDAPYWSEISDDAKDFISKLLVLETSGRLTAMEAKEHVWFQKAALEEQRTAATEEFKDKVRAQIVNYASFGEFKKLALNVIAKKSTSTEIFELRKVFDEFDKQNTGTITLEEFREALAHLEYDEDTVQRLFRKVDVNRTDVINYTEFLAACLETQGAIEEYRLAEAFDMMDSDDTGFISRENLRQILGPRSDERYIDKLIAEADFKKDGRISYAEFRQVFTNTNQEFVSSLYEKIEAISNAEEEEADNEVLRKHGLLQSIRDSWTARPAGSGKSSNVSGKSSNTSVASGEAAPKNLWSILGSPRPKENTQNPGQV